MFRAILLIIKRVNCINTAVQSYAMILFGLNAYSNTANYILVILDYTLAFRVTTPNAVLIHFNLLMMSEIAQNM
jgi:hypothetical protein